MATERFPVYSATKGGDTDATANTVVMRDSSGDTAIRRLSLSRLTLSEGEYLTSSAKTSNYTATAADRLLLCDATGGAITISLPAVSGATGQVLAVKRTSASNNVSLDGSGSETIDGATTKTIATQYGFLTVYCDGIVWHIIASGGTIT